MNLDPPPAWLHVFARELWPEVVEEIDRRGRRLLVQRSQVVMFVQALAEYRLATEQLNGEGVVVDEDHETFTVMKAHPAFRVQAVCIDQAERLIKSLGLNEPLEEESQTALDGLAGWLDRAGRGCKN